MAHRSPARWLAPLALVVCAVAVFAVVQGDRSSDGGGPSGATATTSTAKRKAAGSGAGKARASAKQKRYYTVKSGDVLSAIAAAHGTTVQQIQTLNPAIDARALHVGQKIRLPR